MTRPNQGLSSLASGGGKMRDPGNEVARSKTSSDPKRGNLEEDDVQMPLKLVKELLKQQESTLKVSLSAYMDSVNTRIDNLMKDVQSVWQISYLW